MRPSITRPPCYCGKRGCMEQWVSGPAIARDFEQATGRALTTREIAHALAEGDVDAAAAMDRFEDRLARGLAQLVHILDPDVIVFGGGVSRIGRFYGNVPARVQSYTFGGDFDTPLVPATYGDSSGVRGAAWLWPPVPGLPPAVP
jgi:fructokinase